MALTKHQTIILEGLEARLESLSTPGAGGCALPDEVKEAVRLYVQTWCLPLVQEMLDPTTDWQSRELIAWDAISARWDAISARH